MDELRNQENENPEKEPEFTYRDPYAQGKQKNTGNGAGMFVAGFLLALLIVVGIFAVFSIINHSNANNGDTGTVVNNTTTSNQSGSQNSTLSSAFQKKLQLLQQMISSYYLFDTDDADTETAMLKAYLEAYGDPYTVYYTEEEYEELQQSTNGVYSGIGVVVTQNATTGVVSVVRPYEGAPGYEAGIRTDDVIYKVAGEEVTGISLELVVTKIKGEEGTTVDMTIYRPSTGEYIDMTVERRTIEIETVSSKMLDDELGYIEVSSFDGVTYTQFRQAYMNLQEQGMKGLIVDLRNNGGGLLDIVVAMLDDMLPEGIITYTIDKNGKREEYTSNSKYILDVPMVILTNGNTASAAEIFTGAMKDYGMAEIVGTQTFGKGIVQGIYPLGDGSAVKITISRYYTPSGVCIHGEGITPDVVIENDAETEEDEQMEKAIEILEKKIQ